MAEAENVTLTIDGRTVTVPKGTNIIEAAKTIGIEIPHYCYHPCLSVVGNCRMCQVEVAKAPKLMIGCHTTVQEGMEVRTHLTSQAVRDAQAATLEFILINHPLDCTVCDQSGHCKLQDYHFEYSAKASRFIEEKVHKVKAEPLGPTVILDGERCIMCTRCIRFCDEITKTSELGMLNRGDRSVIAVNPGKQLDNPLSGTVVDLCPVGALTHRHWRFKSRIWFTKETNTICPGCSTGCNCRVAARDGQVVQVKGRMNAAVNKEWMCDEGRYGFHRFLPEQRLLGARAGGKETSAAEAAAAAAELGSKPLAVFLAPDLLLEEYVVWKRFLDHCVRNYSAALAFRERTLTETEAILISPDYAANFRGAQQAGLAVQDKLEEHYENLFQKLKQGVYAHALIIGDRAFDARDIGEELKQALEKLEMSAGVLTDAASPLAASLKVVFPGRSILEKSGLMVNRAGRLQYAERCLDYPAGTSSDPQIAITLAAARGKTIVEAGSDRELTLEYLQSQQRLKGLTIKDLKIRGGVPLLPEGEE